MTISPCKHETAEGVGGLLICSDCGEVLAMTGQVAVIEPDPKPQVEGEGSGAPDSAADGYGWGARAESFDWGGRDSI